MALAVVFAVALPTSVAAQGTPTGTISGYIVDPAGLAGPGARVAVESENTGAMRDVFSNHQGLYSVPALLPGPYNITV